MVSTVVGCTAVAFCTFPCCGCTVVAVEGTPGEKDVRAMTFTESTMCREQRIELGIPRRVYAPSAVFNANRDRYHAINSLNQAAWWRRNFYDVYYEGETDFERAAFVRDELRRARQYREWAEEGGFKLP